MTDVFDPAYGGTLAWRAEMLGSPGWMVRWDAGAFGWLHLEYVEEGRRLEALKKIMEARK